MYGVFPGTGNINAIPTNSVSKALEAIAEFYDCTFLITIGTGSITPFFDSKHKNPKL